jgi:hypothetical protein
MNFSAVIANFAKKVIKGVEEVRREAIYETFSAVVIETPVKTGLARSNWRASLGFPTRTMVPIRSEATVLDEIKQVLAAYVGNMRLFFRNSAPHTIFLEMGSSSQAPEGMLRKNILLFPQRMREALRKFK